MILNSPGASTVGCRIRKGKMEYIFPKIGANSYPTLSPFVVSETFLFDQISTKNVLEI